MRFRQHRGKRVRPLSVASDGACAQSDSGNIERLVAETQRAEDFSDRAISVIVGGGLCAPYQVSPLRAMDSGAMFKGVDGGGFGALRLNDAVDAKEVAFLEKNSAFVGIKNQR